MYMAGTVPSHTVDIQTGQDEQICEYEKRGMVVLSDSHFVHVIISAR